MTKIAFCCPGQGSVEMGMGRDVAEAVPEARSVFERGSAASGLDLERLCFHAEPGELVDTAVQQPALVATSLAMLAAVRARGIEPDFVVGHSVGEFAALAAAEAMSIEDALGATEAAAYDLSAGCTGFMYALAQGYGMLAGGLAKRALVVGGDVLSRILDWEDRSTLVLFGDGAGAVVLEPAAEKGFLGFELGADGGGGANLWLPGSGSRLFDHPERYVKMNGREVFRFATRILVQSAQALLERCGVSIDEVDVYVPHQANTRIIDHATRKLGVPSERVVINVDRYGNTSSGSIPLALADAAADGRLRPGELVLMTGMGAGLTWGSALMRWSKEMS